MIEIICPYSKKGLPCKYSHFNSFSCYDYCDKCDIKKSYKSFDDKLETETRMKMIKIEFAIYKALLITVLGLCAFGTIELIKAVTN